MDTGEAFDKNKKSIFLLHGSGQSHVVWSLTTQYLSDHNFNVFALTVSAEAGELSIQFRAFSFPKFISFLANGCVHGSVEQLAHSFFNEPDRQAHESTDH